MATLNNKISATTRDEMIKFFTEDCAYRERIAMSTLGVRTLTGAELRECVKDADDATFREYGYRVRDLFV